MSSLHNILRLAGVRLDEIFAENPRINDKIEKALAAYPKPMQTKILYTAWKHFVISGRTVVRSALGWPCTRIT